MDIPLLDEISQIPAMLEDLPTLRANVAKKIADEQFKQKQQYDKKRKLPTKYKEGDHVMIDKQNTSGGGSHKLNFPYDGPMMVKKVLPNDRYIVTDLPNSHRTTKATRYEKVIAVDKIKPASKSGGVSDETDSESGEDGVPLSEDNVKGSEHLGTR